MPFLKPQTIAGTECDAKLNYLDNLTRQTLELFAQTELAVEKLAKERARCKMSGHRAAAVAKELRQLRIVLGEYSYQHTADNA